MDDLHARQKTTIRAAFVLSTVHWMCFAMEVSILAFVAKDLRINDVYFGYAITTSALAQLITSPIYSRLAGANLRKAVSVAFVSASASYLLAALSDGFWMLFLSRVASAFVHAMVAAQTAIAMATKSEERTAMFGKLGATFGIGFTVGSALGGAIGRTISLRLPLYISSAVCAITAIVGPWFIKIDQKSISKSETEKDTEESSSQGLRGYLRLLGSGQVGVTLLAKTLAFIPMNTMLTIFGVYLIEQFKTDPGSNATMMIYLGLCMTVMNGGGVGFLKKYFSDKGLLYLGIASFGTTAIGIILSSSYYDFFFIMAALSMAISLTASSTDSILTSDVSSNDHALVLGLAWAIDSLTRVIAPTLAAFMLSRYGFASFGYVELVAVAAAASSVYLFL